MVGSMERWNGKVVVVTGASAGIGANIAQELVRYGMQVIGLARRTEPIEQLSKDLHDHEGKLIAMKCDVTNFNEIVEVFKQIEEKFGAIHVLINNAGILANTTLIDGNIEKWKKVFDTNVMGLCVCTKEAIANMKKYDVDDGHIIHINSSTGHYVPPFAGMNVYPASKFAVTALTETLRVELCHMESHIKVTSISPGGVRTDIAVAAGMSFDINSLTDIPFIEAEDVTDCVIFALATPKHVQVHELIVRAVGEKY